MTAVATAQALAAEAPTPTLCLVMIVRNEGPRMPRLLESLKGLIDEVVISDTGSTDNTIEATREYCITELNVRCVVDQTPFKDFGFNRSRSVTVAIEKSSCDYLLFMDADMRLVLGPDFSKRNLLGCVVDVLSLMQKGAGLEYYNMRIMRRTIKNLRCVGVTHEHYTWEGPHTITNVPPEVVYINDIGDGGSKADKFPRDYRLLKQGLEDEPTNVRYMFYLGETCRHDHKFEESIKYYKMRVKAGGWDEEIYRAMYGISMCYMCMGNADKMDSWAIRAHLFRPSRIESLYTACKWHRERGQNIRAYAFYQLGSRVARHTSEVLFVETAPYEWAWDHEFAILAYYVERETQDRPAHLKNPIGKTLCLRRIISSLGSAASRGTLIPTEAFDNRVSNVKHYAELLPLAFRREDLNTPTLSGFTSSTPCIANLTAWKGISRLVRHVDYKIKRDDGGYIYSADGSVNSLYSLQCQDEEWKTLRIVCDRIPEWKATRIKGIEDIHIFDIPNALRPRISHLAADVPPVNEQTVYGLGTSVQYSVDGRAAMILLQIDMVSATAYPVRRYQRINDWEKNHAPISGSQYCVHSWGPRLKIYDLVQSTSDKLIFTHDFPEAEIPGWFRDMRGSTPGIPYPSNGGKVLEYWFLTHTVVHASPRRYMHSVVVLDAETMRPKAFTIPFSFDDYHVEFAGGLAFADSDDTLIVSYSVFDSSSREIRIPVKWLNKNMFIGGAHELERG